jgi:hypothetical protein
LRIGMPASQTAGPGLAWPDSEAPRWARIGPELSSRCAERITLTLR